MRGSREAWPVSRPAGPPAQRKARAIRARLKNLDIEQIFQHGLHEFITEFLNDNNGLGGAISKQYLV